MKVPGFDNESAGRLPPTLRHAKGGAAQLRDAREFKRNLLQGS